MSGFLEVEIAHFLLKNLPSRMTICSIFNQKLDNFTNREIPPDLIRGSFKNLHSKLFGSDVYFDTLSTYSYLRF